MDARSGNRPSLREAEVGGLVARSLQNDNGKAELKDDLQVHQRKEGVIVPLFSRGEKMCDQCQGHQARERGPATSQHGKDDCGIQAEQMRNPPGKAIVLRDGMAGGPGVNGSFLKDFRWSNDVKTRNAPCVLKQFILIGRVRHRHSSQGPDASEEVRPPGL